MRILIAILAVLAVGAASEARIITVDDDGPADLPSEEGRCDSWKTSRLN